MALTIMDLEVLVGADTTQAEQGLDNVNTKVDDLANNPNFDKASVGLMGIGTAGILGFGKSVFAAMDFETSLVDLGIATNTTGDDLDALKMKVLDLGAAFPYSAGEVADLMTELAKIGFFGTDLDLVTESTMNLATALGTELLPTGEAINAVLKSFNMSAENASEIADQMYRILAAGSLDLDTLMNAWQYLGGVVDLAGLSFVEAGAFLSILTDRAIPAERAGRALKKMFTSLINPSAELLDMLSSLGISFTNAEGSMLGVKDIIFNIIDAWQNLTSQEQIDLATMLVGTEFMDVAIALFDSGREAWDRFMEGYEGAISIVDAVKMKMESAKQIWETFKETIQNISIVVGEQLLPAFNRAIGVATNLGDKIVDLPSGMLKTIAVVGTLGSAFMFLAGFLGVASKNIGVVTTGLRILLATATGPLGIILALAGAFYLAYQHSETFRNIIQSLVGVFQDTFDVVMESVNNLVDAFSKGGLQGVIKSLPKELSNIGGAFKTLGKSIKISFKDVGSLILKSLEPVSSFGSNLLNRLRSSISGMSIGDIFNTLRGTLANALTNVLQSVADGAADLLNRITSVVTSIDWGNLGSLVAQGLTAIVAAFYGLGALIGTALFDAIRNVDWSNLGTAILNALQAVFNAIVNFVVGFGSTLVGIFRSINWSGVFDGIRNAATSIFNWITNAISNIDWSALIQGGWDIINQGISLAWDAITSLDWKSYIPDFGQWGDWITGKLASAKDWGISTFGGWASFITQKIGSLGDWGIGDFGGWKDWIFKIGSLAKWGIPAFGAWKTYLFAIEKLADWGIPGFGQWSEWMFKIDSLAAWGIGEFGKWLDYITNPFENFSLPEFSWPSVDDILNWIFGPQKWESNPDGSITETDTGTTAVPVPEASPASPSATPTATPTAPGFGSSNLMSGGMGSGSAFNQIAASANQARQALDNFNTTQTKTGSQSVTSFGQIDQSARPALVGVESHVNTSSNSMRGIWATSLGQMAASALSNFDSIRSLASNNTNQARGAVTSNAVAMASNLGSQMAAMAATSRTQMTASYSSVNSQMSAMNSATSVQTMAMAAVTRVQMALMVATAQTQMNSMASNVQSGGVAASGYLTAQSARWSAIILSAGASAASTARSVGYNIGSGVAAGLNSAIGAVAAAANRIVAEVDKAIRAKARIASPAKMFMYHGSMIGEGFALGIQSAIKDVSKAGEELTNAAIHPASIGVPHSNGYTSLSSPNTGGYVINNPTYNVNIEVKELDEYRSANEFFQSLDSELALA